MKIKQRIFDASTGETQDIEREATFEEIAAYENAQIEIAELTAKAAEAAVAKAAVLAKLGITEDEAKLLLS